MLADHHWYVMSSNQLGIPWVKFLPSDYKEIIFSSVSDSSLITTLFKKDLFFNLSHNPISITNDSMSYALEKVSDWGKRALSSMGRYTQPLEVDFSTKI
ncbi:hypothetical protein WN944_026537 [Citrus x changshan-huyou]|uniref:Uncharacterized protein n=3 Tax=Citrus TaxID=2706 RepID=V4RJ65_CITCL|nr:hypothetical protein CICLE_v10006304mg [Citrus x clementina]GAY64689.1 hypothetical protein CUMW_235390 [Citrus unshiu]